MAGGPFVDLPLAAISEARAHLAWLQAEGAPLLTLAQDFADLDRQLQTVASGYSLAGLYGEVPTSLKGVVELAYDLNCRPGIRLFERAIRQQKASRRLQQLYVGPLDVDNRPFFLTTPRISAGEGVIITREFADPAVDLLGRATLNGVHWGAIVRGFGAPLAEELRPFLTTVRDRGASPQAAPPTLRVRHFGHACVAIEGAGRSILIDPLVAWPGNDAERLNLRDLPSQIDDVVISHAHHDHFCAETLLQIRHKVGRIIVPRNNSACAADPSLALAAEELGFERVVELDPFEEIAFDGGQIVSLPFLGEHSDLQIFSKQSVLVRIGGKTLLFLVDSKAHELALYEEISRRYGSIDALFIGMECHGAPLSWLYGPLLTKPISRRDDESRRLDASDADQAWGVVKVLKPRRAFLYAMGQEPWVRHYSGFAYDENSVQLREARKFKALCEAGGVAAEHLVGTTDIVI